MQTVLFKIRCTQDRIKYIPDVIDKLSIISSKDDKYGKYRKDSI